MDSTFDLTLKGEKISTKSFDKPLAQLLVDVYSMPKWNKDKTKNTEGKILCLINSSKLVVGDIPESDLNKINNMSAYSKLIKSAKDLAIKNIQEIYPTGATYKYIIKINEYLVTNGLANEEEAEIICGLLETDIGAKKSENEIKKQHMVTIQELLNESLGNFVSIKENDLSGANAGFIAIDKNDCRYFVKTFSELSSSTKKIDCRELFAYKVLEHLGFGPETHCLIQKFSSSQGSKTKGSYIVTKDVGVVDKKDELKKEFFRDDDKDGLTYCEAVNDKGFLVELFSIASINSILRLRDTFGDNTGNYGIVKTTMKNESFKYEPILIDHLPCTSNGIIDEGYSPGKFLTKSLNSQSEKASSKDSNLQKVITENFSSKDMKLTEKVQCLVNEGKGGKNFETSIDEALKYVLELIKINSNSFADEKTEGGHVISAQKMLENHVSVVFQNYKMFLDNYK